MEEAIKSVLKRKCMPQNTIQALGILTSTFFRQLASVEGIILKQMSSHTSPNTIYRKYLGMERRNAHKLCYYNFIDALQTNAEKISSDRI